MAIEKSYIDMLKERDAKIEALKELLKLAHESLDSKDERIAELEKEASNRKGFWVTRKDLHVWQLEQQTLALSDARHDFTYSSDAICVNVDDLDKRIEKLQCQAKALKEPKI
jgi:hypothetical protein